MHEMHLGFDLRTGDTSDSPRFSGEFVAAFFVEIGKARCGLLFSAGRAHPAVLEQRYSADGKEANSNHGLPEAFPVGKWIRVNIDADLSRPSFSVSYDGRPVVTDEGLSAGCLGSGIVALYMGAHCSPPNQLPVEGRLDNITFEGK